MKFISKIKYNYKVKLRQLHFQLFFLYMVTLLIGEVAIYMMVSVLLHMGT